MTTSNSTLDLLLAKRTYEDVKYDALFRHGYLTGNGKNLDQKNFVSSIIGLAKLFNIEVNGDIEHLDETSIHTAQRNIGYDVPEPFYRGFPESVRNLTSDQRLIDQAIHYLLTYGIGLFNSAPSHSLFEEPITRKLFSESTTIRKMTVVSPEKANELILEWVNAILASKRPASAEEMALIISTIKTTPDFKIDNVACKETLVQLTEATRDNTFLKFFKLENVLDLTEWLAFNEYCHDTYRWHPKNNNIYNLNLKNRDRKLITRALNTVFSRELTLDEKYLCYEHKKAWAGLLHHIHYKPINDNAASFAKTMRGRENKSRMSTFEKLVAQGQVVKASAYIANKKGQGALIRHLDYLISRANSPKEIAGIVQNIHCTDTVQLMQLLLHYMEPESDFNRSFMFSKNYTLHVHTESEEEKSTRRTNLPQNMRNSLAKHVFKLLQNACSKKNKIGKVFIDPVMSQMAIPINESTSNTGYKTLTRGSRIDLNDAKTIRAFTYWEKVNDIDLSAIGLDDEFNITEFSWRNMYNRQSDAITYSGDITNGYNGGSEYFDINLEALKAKYPKLHYLVICDNVYSGIPFDRCNVRAGYMLREDATAGKVFEPTTVETAFAVNGNSTFNYMFAIDLDRNQIIWLNIIRASGTRIAGESGKNTFLTKYFNITDTLNIAMLATLRASEVTNDINNADIAFLPERQEIDNVEVITPADTEKLRTLLL